MNMRIVDFPNSTDLKFRGNVYKNAICFGDVDNDGLNELVVGNIDGDLSIFKGLKRTAHWTGRQLGLISGVTVGNALNTGKNILVVVTGCGYMYLFNVNETNPGDILQPYHVQTIPPNAKCVLVADMMGNGIFEIVIGMTDRVVRTFLWTFSKAYDGGKPIGKLVSRRKWDVSEQIGNVALHHPPGGRPTLLVSQSGPVCFSLWVEPTSANVPIPEEDEGELAIQHLPLSSARFRQSHRATEVCGDIRNGQGEMMYAVGSLDGTIILAQEDSIKCNVHMDNEIFALFPLDVNADGVDEVVACAWDGNTYIVNHEGDCVNFMFPQPVRTFVAGLYGLRGRQVPCLAYNTFENRITLHHQIHITHFVNPNLTRLLQEDEQYRKLVTQIGLDVNNFDVLRKLNHFLLYGIHPNRDKPASSDSKTKKGGEAMKTTGGASAAATSDEASAQFASAQFASTQFASTQFASAQVASPQFASAEPESTAAFSGARSKRMESSTLGFSLGGTPAVGSEMGLPGAGPEMESSGAGSQAFQDPLIMSQSMESSALGTMSRESSTVGSLSSAVSSLSIGSSLTGYKSAKYEGDYGRATGSTYLDAEAGGTYPHTYSEDSGEISEDVLSVYDVDLEDCIYDTSSEATSESSYHGSLGPNVGYVNVNDPTVDNSNGDDLISSDSTGGGAGAGGRRFARYDEIDGSVGSSDGNNNYEAGGGGGGGESHDNWSSNVEVVSSPIDTVSESGEDDAEVSSGGGGGGGGGGGSPMPRAASYHSDKESEHHKSSSSSSSSSDSKEDIGSTPDRKWPSPNTF